MRGTYYPEVMNNIVPYIPALYYIEIIYAMLTLFMTAGKIPGIVIGFLFGILISIHIVFLFFRKNYSRIIQLVLMDIHAAYSGAFVINFIINGLNFNMASGFIFTFRILMFFVEVPMIFHLSSDKAKKFYI